MLSYYYGKINDGNMCMKFVVLRNCLTTAIIMQFCCYFILQKCNWTRAIAINLLGLPEIWHVRIRGTCILLYNPCKFFCFIQINNFIKPFQDADRYIITIVHHHHVYAMHTFNLAFCNRLWCCSPIYPIITDWDIRVSD